MKFSFSSPRTKVVGVEKDKVKSKPNVEKENLLLSKIGVGILWSFLGAAMVALLVYSIRRDFQSRIDFFEASAEIYRVKFEDTFVNLVGRVTSIGTVARLELGSVVAILDNLVKHFVDENQAFKWFNLGYIVAHEDRAEYEMKIARYVNETYPEFATPGELVPREFRVSGGIAPNATEYLGVIAYRYPRREDIFSFLTSAAFALHRSPNITCGPPFAAKIIEKGEPAIPCYLTFTNYFDEEMSAAGSLRVNKLLDSLSIVEGLTAILLDVTDTANTIPLSAVQRENGLTSQIDLEETPIEPLNYGDQVKTFEMPLFDRVYRLHIIAGDAYLAWNSTVYAIAVGILVVLFAGTNFGFFKYVQMHQRFHEIMEENIEKSYVFLLGTMTHALRNPIHALTYYTETLQHGFEVVDENRVAETESSKNEKPLLRVNDDFMETISTLWATANHVHDICNSFMDYQQLTVTELNLRERPCDLLEIVREVVTQYRVFNEPRVKVELDIQPDIENVFRDIDGLRFRQIIGNGLSNSCKLTKSGEVRTTVRVVKGSQTILSSPETDHQWYVVICVLDTGLGIPEEYLGKLFVEYERGAKPLNVESRAASSGLGLAISRQLARLMKGEVTLENRGDGVTGAKFSITLPVPNSCRISRTVSHASSCSRSTDDHLGEERTVEEVHATNIQKQRKKSISKKIKDDDLLKTVSVCYAEDDYTNNKIFARMIKRAGIGYSFGFFDGSELLAYCKQCLETGNPLPDLMFLDIVMEIMGGEETLAELKKLGIKVPIVAVTGNALLDEVERYTKIGFCDVVTKPFTVDHIRVCVLRNLHCEVEVKVH